MVIWLKCFPKDNWRRAITKINFNCNFGMWYILQSVYCYLYPLTCRHHVHGDWKCKLKMEIENVGSWHKLLEGNWRLNRCHLYGTTKCLHLTVDTIQLLCTVTMMYAIEWIIQNILYLYVSLYITVWQCDYLPIDSQDYTRWTIRDREQLLILHEKRQLSSTRINVI